MNISSRELRIAIVEHLITFLQETKNWSANIVVIDKPLGKRVHCAPMQDGPVNGKTEFFDWIRIFGPRITRLFTGGLDPEMEPL